MSLLDEFGRIPTYKVQNEVPLLERLSDDMPSKRIIRTKKGLKAIKALIELEKNDNVSWYQYLKKRSVDCMDSLALFYRGTKISFGEMFSKADIIAKSMSKSGLVAGDEIGVCVSNSPELVYILLAANKLGLKVNLFGSNYNCEYISKILDGVSKKVLFVSDDNYRQIESIIKDKKFDNVIVSSLADSLPKNPEECDEYEPELAEYYHFDDNSKQIVSELPNAMTFSDYYEDGKTYEGPVEECGDLETDFLVTYTSGSTKIGFPKAIIHKNRSLNTMGRFHDPELCGNPKIPGLRGLAHIHADSNTNIITCISDNLMQGWSVALEPEYDEKKALDYVMLNKPNYLDITTSFLLEMAKQYLVDKRFHKNGKGRKLPFLLAAFAVGEGAQPGEEKFINKFLRVSRAGSGVSIKGLKMPFTTLSIGGGDCEHGGIYYTLWKALYQKLYTPILRKKPIGLLPVPYVVVTCLKKNELGQYVECGYNESGIIVANSYTNLSAYKDNPEATEKMIITDNLGRKWVSCNTFGYIDKIGGVHVKGRVPEKRLVPVEPFEIDDVVTLDTKNILTSSTVVVDANYVITIQFQPLEKINTEKVLKSLYKRLSNRFSDLLLDCIYVRIIPPRDSYPLTGSGKRSARMLEQMKFDNTFKVTDIIKKQEQEKIM